MVAPLVLLFLLGTIETGLFFAARHNLQNAIYDASRLGRSGYSQEGEDRETYVRARLKERVSPSLLDPDRVELDIRAYESFSGLGRPEPFDDRNGDGRWQEGEDFVDVNENGRWDADQGRAGLGGASQIVLYEARYPWLFFTPLVGGLLGEDNRLTLSASAVVQNEPY